MLRQICNTASPSIALDPDRQLVCNTSYALPAFLPGCKAPHDDTGQRLQMTTRNDALTPVIWSLNERGVAEVVLNRAQVGNAYDGEMIDGLHRAMDDLGHRSSLRVVVLKGVGRHFQAGADLKWLNEVRTGSHIENVAASQATADAVDRLNRLPVPTVALVQGFCIGGGTGMIAACDVVIAADDAQFAISEVRWGLTAAIIIPQLVDAIGVRQLRRYALTGERFGAYEAEHIGLVHSVVPAGDLARKGDEIVAALLAVGPRALAETKAHILDLSTARRADLAALIEAHALKRQSDEAAEGLASFADKRDARWNLKA